MQQFLKWLLIWKNFFQVFLNKNLIDQFYPNYTLNG